MIFPTNYSSRLTPATALPFDTPTIDRLHVPNTLRDQPLPARSRNKAMTDETPKSPVRIEHVALGGILLLFTTLSALGMAWGLPSRAIDESLFGGRPPWTGEKIHRLAGATDKFSRVRGADVDADPLARPPDAAVPLTATEADLARIYLRYRLFTHQPDEMITMMALAGMNPAQLDLDPRLYQYGGLFIYPVGALIGLCDVLGLIDVRSNVVYYLDHPDDFAKFYVAARAYAALWGLVGTITVFAIGRRLAGPAAGVLAALLFTLLPVVISMSHEAKPHLPGAALMLLAVYVAMRFVSSGTRCSWRGMCLCCGASFGTVLSSWPIFILIPLGALLRQGRRENPGGGPVDPEPDTRRGQSFKWGAVLLRVAGGTAIGIGTYLATNPYIVINAISNREVLSSNFGNSLAMYRVDRLGEGLVRVAELCIEGATLPIVLLGLLGLGIALAKKKTTAAPLTVSALLFFLQFVLIGAGKPAEYGRFGVFPDAALAIGAACVLAGWGTKLAPALRATPAVWVVISTACFGAPYVWNFHLDATSRGTRAELARVFRGNTIPAQLLGGNERPSDGLGASPAISGGLTAEGIPSAHPTTRVGVLGEPAPYCCPPMDFASIDMRLFSSSAEFTEDDWSEAAILLYPTDLNPPLLAAKGRPITDEIETGEGVVERAGRVVWPTPISWANKPFFITDRERASPNTPPPASDWIK